MKKLGFLSILVPLIGAATALRADTDPSALVVTASNAAKNQLLVYDSGGKLIQTILRRVRAASAATPAVSTRKTV